jgi:hypothetical protein
MKLFTMFIVMAIWVFIAVYLPTNLIAFNPFMVLYLMGITWFSMTKVVNFLVWNLYSVED